MLISRVPETSEHMKPKVFLSYYYVYVNFHKPHKPKELFSQIVSLSLMASLSRLVFYHNLWNIVSTTEYATQK